MPTPLKSAGLVRKTSRGQLLGGRSIDWHKSWEPHYFRQTLPPPQLNVSSKIGGFFYLFQGSLQSFAEVQMQAFGDHSFCMGKKIKSAWPQLVPLSSLPPTTIHAGSRILWTEVKKNKSIQTTEPHREMLSHVMGPDSMMWSSPVLAVTTHARGGSSEQGCEAGGGFLVCVKVKGWDFGGIFSKRSILSGLSVKHGINVSCYLCISWQSFLKSTVNWYRAQVAWAFCGVFSDNWKQTHPPWADFDKLTGWDTAHWSPQAANPTPGSLLMLSLLILVFHLAILGTAWPNQGTEQAIFKRIMKFDFPNFCPKCCRGNLQRLFYKDLLSFNPSTSEQNKKDREGAYNASAISVHGPWGIGFFFYYFFSINTTV